SWTEVSVTRSKPIPDVDPRYYEMVGHIASDWSTLEYVVNHVIWKAARVDEQLGACITAQIISLPNRLEALALLLRARGASEKLQARLEKLITRSRKPTDLRKRAVHDPLGVNSSDGRTQQLQITARGKLVFQLRDISLDSLRSDEKEINRFIRDFFIF